MTDRTELIRLTIDAQEVQVPPGTLVVDAAKRVGVRIPLFCYHPKLEPAGMCRMCLVEIGRPLIDRASGNPFQDESGNYKMQFGPKLETACTTPVSEGMVVRTASEKVAAARREVLEFLLTSHPLDCPVCDKGGECPLQNLTYAYGPGKSRFLFDEKMHLAKQVPLGELIVLDRERCIQCGRCVRFCQDIAGDDVLAFSQRGRSLQIVTHSQPGFASYFSGNTTDICPVGALTTVDFRFGARPWEMKAVASICPHCAVGCNLSYQVRREARAGGKVVIKRALPRQNEQVNETWICDKGRWGYHFTESPERLTRPLLRKNGALEPVSWEEALAFAADGLRALAPGDMLTLAGGRLPNEDLFTLLRFTEKSQGKAILHSPMAGGDLVSLIGSGEGTNLSDLHQGDLVILVACDIEEEAPLWFLRLKEACWRGAALLEINPRPTKISRYASHSLRYAYGEEPLMLSSLLSALMPAGDSARFGNLRPSAAAEAAIKEAVSLYNAAENVLVFFGSDGLGIAGSETVARLCAELAVRKGRVGEAKNGIIGVWPQPNTQGAWEIGYQAAEDLEAQIHHASVLYLAAADLLGDSPGLGAMLQKKRLVIVQELFLTRTAAAADVVFPTASHAERQGTFTSGERRVQRFYPALPPLPDTLPDFRITQRLEKLLQMSSLPENLPALFQSLVEAVPSFRGLTYAAISQSPEQWPPVGGEDLYFGGTCCRNMQGIGARLPFSGAVHTIFDLPGVSLGKRIAYTMPVDNPQAIRLVPITRLYDRGTTLLPSRLLESRREQPRLYLHPQEAGDRRLVNGSLVTIPLDCEEILLEVWVDAAVPQGVGVVCRSGALPIDSPMIVRLRADDGYNRTP